MTFTFEKNVHQRDLRGGGVTVTLPTKYLKQQYIAYCVEMGISYFSAFSTEIEKFPFNEYVPSFKDCYM